jgi:hypothetical protein
MHNMDHAFAGMSVAMGHRGVTHGLPKLETHGINNMDFSGGLRTAPPLAFGANEFDFEGLLFGNSTINPNALHYSDSPQSMAIDPTSPYSHGMHDMSVHHLDDTIDWLSGFDQQMSIQANETAVDGSSPSAISTTSQSGMSDVMLDGSNHPATTTASSMWPQTSMGPPQMANNPYAMDLSGSVFPDLMNGAPISPQPTSRKINDPYFSTPPPSMTSLSPSLVNGMGSHHINQALAFNAAPETPSSIHGGNLGTSPVSTITDATRNAIVAALTQRSAFGRKYSFQTPGSPLSPQLQTAPLNATDDGKNLPSTQDLQRYVAAYLRYFHPHFPFLHVPTLSFDVPTATANGRAAGLGGTGCLALSMAAIGALYEMDHAQSRELFEMAKKMLQLYLEERRKAEMKKADFLRTPATTEQNAKPAQSQEPAVHTPVWLVQAMLLNVVYGHNCGDKTASDIASTHCAALVSLAKGANLLRRGKDDNQVTAMEDWNGVKVESEEHAEWLKWKAMEERKRTLYAVFILSSMLVLGYNHTPALTNSEIILDLPCEEEYFAAESAAIFHAKGGVQGANMNKMTFHEALGELLRTNEKQKQAAALNGQGFGANGNNNLPPSELKPSTFGSLILINALHNYIWETRQRHHNKVWTNEETETMHRHIEPALKAWQAAWGRNPNHVLERPHPYGLGPLSADSTPLLDLAYVRLFVNLSRSKEKFWQRDWDGVAEELAKGSEIVQHAEQTPESNSESNGTEPSDTSMTSSGLIDSPATQLSSPDFSSHKFPPQATGNNGSTQNNNSISRRERHLRKAAFYAADSLMMSDRLGVTFADFNSRELPLQSAMCAFDCAQVLAEWAATLQDRVGRYMGVLGQDEVDLHGVPAIMLLEDEDVKLLDKMQEIVSSAGAKINMDVAGRNVNSRLNTADHAGYATKILRVTAFMLDKAAVWPTTHLMARCLETHANHMRTRAEKSILTCGE